MIKCIIIDDEPLAIQLLTNYAQKSKDLEVVDTFSNPIEALHALSLQDVDLLFLDIQMPELTGIQLMKITNGKYEIILTTAYDQYALDSYDFDVVDYLLKPITLDRFMMAVEKAKKRLSPTPIDSTASEPAIAKDYMFVKSGTKTLKVNLSTILRLEALGDYVAIHTTAGEKILSAENMSYFEVSLPEADFMRVHRSHIVAFSHIDFIERNRIVIQGKRIPISVSYQQAFWVRVSA
ncbi:MAG: LytTR family DNA-binding domain-containing protein [Bacteroidota bacterium]